MVIVITPYCWTQVIRIGILFNVCSITLEVGISYWFGLDLSIVFLSVDVNNYYKISKQQNQFILKSLYIILFYTRRKLYKLITLFVT